MKKTLLLLPLLFLGACATPEQQEAWRRMQEEEDIATCAGYGLRQGSEAFGNCRLQLDLARQYYYEHPRAHYYGGYSSYGPRYGSGVYYGY